MIFDIIQQEQIVWSAVYQEDRSLSELGIAYYYPKMPEIIHWNLFYPATRDTSFKREDLERINQLYQSHGIKGHLLSFGQFPTEWAVSEDEFLLQPVHFQSPEIAAPLTARPAKDVHEFAAIVRQVFELNDKFITDFTEQSIRAQKSGINVRHFLASCGGETCGSFSLFQTSDDYDFRMNTGLLPKFRGRKLSYCLSALASLQTPRKLMTHTNNIRLRKLVLPKTGFRSEGEAFIIPLAKLLKEIKK